VNFKVLFFFTIKIDEETKQKKVTLKRECYLNFVPFENMKITMNHKRHRLGEIVYDLDNDIFIVELSEDTPFNLRVLNTTFEELTDEYLKSGWERTSPENKKQEAN